MGGGVRAALKNCAQEPHRTLLSFRPVSISSLKIPVIVLEIRDYKTKLDVMPYYNVREVLNLVEE